VRCVHCQADPAPAEHFCGCCGRELSAAVTDATPVARCESCGGPSPSGTLCDACQAAFSPLLDSHLAEAPVQHSPSPDEAAEAEKAAALKAEALKAEAAAKAEAARKIAASVVADRAAAAARREREDLVRTPRPVVVAPAPTIAKRTPSRSMLLTVAAVAVMGIVGVAQKDFLLGQFKSGRAAVEGQAAQLDPAAIAASLRAPLPDISSNKPAPAKAVQPRTSRTAVKTRDKVDSSNRPVKADSVPIEVSAPKVSEAPVPAAAEPRLTESAQPTGKFFEPNDVDVSPIVAKRIEPKLPPELKARGVSGVVIVRVLVSQTGDPSRVSLLRKSKQGRVLDEAVVAAVTQWRFSPARKRGEPVSSWYNIGVPLGQSN